MTIRNSDGSPYKLSGEIVQFDDKNPEFELFNLLDEEVIRIAGSPLYYYEVFITTNDINELYLEARSKLWSPCPKCLYGYYDPITSSNQLGMFGIDSPDEIMFELNYRSVLKTLGHVPKIGSRIFSPHKSENWVIAQRNVEVFKMWGELRLQLLCIRFQESLTTGEGKVVKDNPVNYKINEIKDLSKKKMNLAGGQEQIP